MCSECRPVLSPVYPSTTSICILVHIYISFSMFSQLLSFDLKHSSQVLSKEATIHTGAFFPDRFFLDNFFFKLQHTHEWKLKSFDLEQFSISFFSRILYFRMGEETRKWCERTSLWSACAWESTNQTINASKGRNHLWWKGWVSQEVC